MILSLQSCMRSYFFAMLIGFLYFLFNETAWTVGSIFLLFPFPFPLEMLKFLKSLFRSILYPITEGFEDEYLKDQTFRYLIWEPSSSILLFEMVFLWKFIQIQKLQHFSVDPLPMNFFFLQVVKEFPTVACFLLSYCVLQFHSSMHRITFHHCVSSFKKCMYNFV